MQKKQKGKPASVSASGASTKRFTVVTPSDARSFQRSFQGRSLHTHTEMEMRWRSSMICLSLPLAKRLNSSSFFKRKVPINPLNTWNLFSLRLLVRKSFYSSGSISMRHLKKKKKSYKIL